MKPVSALQKNIFTDNSKAMLLLWIIYVISVLFLLCFHAHMFTDVLWLRARNGLTSWLAFVLSHCEAVIFPLVSWVIVSIPDLRPFPYII